MLETNCILNGDCIDVLKTMPDECIQTVITSPPYYGLRDYGVAGQIGLEETPERFIEKMVEVFREVKRVLKNDGTLWLNLGDSYWSKRSHNGLSYDGYDGMHEKEGAKSLRAGGSHHEYLKPKDLIGIPWRVALALQQDGWYLRSDIIWNKTSVMPEAVKDRPTKCHEYIFLLSKSEKYYYNHEAIREPASSNERAKSFRGGGLYTNNQSFKNSKRVENQTVGNTFNPDGKRNKRTVWNVYPARYSEAHFATFPIELIEPCVLAGTKEGDVVLDPFGGSGTTAEAAIRNRRKYLLIELNPEYIELANNRINGTQIKLL